MTPKVSQLPVCKLRPLLGLATCLTLSWKPDPRHENPVFKKEELYYPCSENKGAVTAQLICVFAFGYADFWFSYAVAQIVFDNMK